MTDDITKSESKLRKLGDHLRKAWAKQHSLTQKELEVVREAVRKQWEAEVRVSRITEPMNHRVSPPPPPPNHRKELEMEQRRQTRAHNRKHDHGHSH